MLLNLIKYADRAKFEIEAACLHGRGVFWEPLRATGVPLRTLSFHHYFPSYAPGLMGLMLARGYDVVHCHLLASNVVAKPIAALCRVPLRINHDHCNDKLTDPRAWALPADTWANRFSTHVIAVSESTRAFVEAHEHVPAKRTTTIHNGIDCETYCPRPEQRSTARQRWDLPEDAFVIGGIGRLTHQKNFALFLEVAAGVLKTHPKVFFVIAGTGEDEAALRAQAGTLGIADRVRFLGFVGEMAALYPALDMLLLTSRYEGLPITILRPWPPACRSSPRASMVLQRFLWMAAMPHCRRRANHRLIFRGSRNSWTSRNWRAPTRVPRWKKCAPITPPPA